MAAPSAGLEAARAGTLSRPVAKPHQPPAGYLSACEMQEVCWLFRRARLVRKIIFPLGEVFFAGGERLAGRYEDQTEKFLGSLPYPQDNSTMKNSHQHEKKIPKQKTLESLSAVLL
jgi:hypothetical protein